MPRRASDPTASTKLRTVEELVKVTQSGRLSRTSRTRAAVARDLVPAELARRGARVEVVEAYRTVAPEHLAERVREVLALRPDCLTFTSSSTVRNLVEAAGAEALRGIPVASIGPITTQTARALGVEVATQAKVYTVEGLVAAVLGLYTEMTPPSEE